MQGVGGSAQGVGRGAWGVRGSAPASSLFVAPDSPSNLNPTGLFEYIEYAFAKSRVTGQREPLLH